LHVRGLTAEHKLVLRYPSQVDSFHLQIKEAGFNILQNNVNYIFMSGLRLPNARFNFKPSSASVQE
jgi:hypothetical protein